METSQRTIDAVFRFAPPGHFYSPHSSIDDVDHSYSEWSARLRNIPGLDICAELQIRLVDTARCQGLLGDWTDAAGGNRRYHFENMFFRFGDAQALFALAGIFRPARVIEVGCGYSTACWLDSIERIGLSTSLTCVEPYPDRLEQLLSAQDLAGRVQLLRCPVQDVSLEYFDALQENDVLFIDSTHVAKAGSDVIYLLFQVIPRLRSGVLVHFHDVFWPFEYPKTWLLEGRSWNEAYLLRAFLTFNSAFEIVRLNSFLATELPDIFASQDRRFLTDHGASIWLRKR